MATDKIVWQDVLETIKISVSPAIFSTWFTQTHLSSLTESGQRVLIEIGCQSPFVKNYLENRYFGLLQDTLVKTLGKPCDLTFVVKENPEKGHLPKTATPLFEEKGGEEEFHQALAKSKMRLGYTFENFAVSSSNQMAHAAAEAVAQNPGSAYNPLFIWGGVGVGKTHLMMAVGNTALKNNLNLKILFCTGESFTNDIIEGIRNKTTQAFRDKYRRLDLLLIDDIQFIAGKDAVQEEFFHTFNAVTAANGQIILTSDRPPSEIAKLEERLRSRFEAGLIIDITPPDFELRCAITQIKAREKGDSKEGKTSFPKMLAMKYSLTGDNNFKQVEEEGEVYQSPSFGLAYLKRDNSSLKFGFIVSNKISHDAYRRNQIKRAMKEAVRYCLTDIKKGYHVVFLAKQTIVRKSTEELMREVKDALKETGLFK